MNTLPVLPFRRLKLSDKITVRLARQQAVMVLVPHPDDETLGCGLLIARLMRAGVRVVIVALTDGDASHPGSRRWPPAALAKLRRAELRRALDRLGAGRCLVRFMGCHDGRLAEEGRKLPIAALCHSLNVGLILASSHRDHHPDHQACFSIGSAVARRLGVPLVSYAVWSRLDDTRHRLECDPGKSAKAWAAAAHRSQVSDFINDAPDGFRLSTHALRQFLGGPERYVKTTNLMIKR